MKDDPLKQTPWCELDRDNWLNALEADGEKLRQLTGEDHGPWFDLGQITIYEALKAKLGREPTDAELKSYVAWILSESK